MMHFSARYWWVALVVIGTLVVLTYRYYGRTVPPLKRPWRIGLGLTRSTGLLLLLLALTETLLLLTPQVADPPVVVGIVDVSGSMRTGATDPAITRAARLWETLVDRLPEKVKPVRFLAADSLLADDAIPSSGGTATALGNALADLKPQFAGKNLSAVVLLSDGNNNLGVDPAPAAGDLGVPVIAIGVGEPDTGLTPTIAAVDVDEVVFANRPFTVRAGVTARRQGRIRLRLVRGVEQIGDVQLDLPAAGQRAEAVFETSVPAAGLHQFRLEPAESPKAGRSFFVKALKEKTRLLLQGFRPDWEFAFLHRILSAMPDVELHAVMPGDRGKTLLDPAPVSGEWGGFDGFILVAPDDRWLGSTWGPMARELLRSGKGVMIILGERTFAPVLESPPTPLGFLRGSPMFSRGEFPVSPEPASMRHPVLRLEDNPEDARRILESFPPFTGVWEIGELPERAAELLVHRRSATTPKSRVIPLVWTAREGAGKALIVNGGPLWRWSFNSAVDPEGVDYYARFLELVVRWLTVTEDLQKQRLEADKEAYALGEPIRLRGFLYDDGYRFLTRASVIARVWPDTGSATTDSASVFLPPGGGEYYEAALTGLRAGTYAYAGTAILDDDTLLMTGSKLTVEMTGLEAAASGLDEGRMRAIAEKSGGRYYHESERIAVLDSMAFASRTFTTRREIEVWNQPWLLVAILVLLSGEWFFRKRRQLL